MIADTGSTPPATHSSADAAASTQALHVSPLSPDELYRLTLYKWRYALEAYGFEAGPVRELMFLKWLYASRRLLS